MAYLTRSTPARPRGKRLVEFSHVQATPEFVSQKLDLTVTAANDETGADIYYRLTLTKNDAMKVRSAIDVLLQGETVR